MRNTLDMVLLAFATIIQLTIYFYVSRRGSRNSIVVKSFRLLILDMIIWNITLFVQIVVLARLSESIATYVVDLIYVPIVFLPVVIFFFAYFMDRKNVFKPSLILTFIVPVFALIMLWTNDMHHLFFTSYSMAKQVTVYGPIFFVHIAYTYSMVAASFVMVVKSSRKRNTKLNNQLILFSLGSLAPVLLDILRITKTIPVSEFATPITLGLTALLWGIAIVKYNFLDLAPIAIKKIVNQMSDAYVVLSRDYTVSDCNETFEKLFEVSGIDIKGENFFDLNLSDKITIDNRSIGTFLEKAQTSRDLYKINATLKNEDKYFIIEISSIINDDSQPVGILVLFKDVTQHRQDMTKLKASQNIMMERERLASLGQMVGGIAHNLKTPIMSIAGAMEGLDDLVNEYEHSIGDPEVTKEDHLSIAHDMHDWIDKVNSYDSYMSDIITTVKGQAVNFSDTSSELFTIDELLKRVTILMRHELKHSFTTLNVVCEIPKETKIVGNINSLVQVVNNLIQNSIQAYEGKPNGTIDLTITQKNNNIFMKIIDHASGIPEDVQDKLFTEMITTKGKNGSGLGLFMSYSTIKGTFNGDLSFHSKEGVGTTFTIRIPTRNEVRS